MVETYADHTALLGKLLTRLSKDIDRTCSLVDNEQQANSLAIILLVKGLDILQSWHGDDTFPIINAIVNDRARRRYVLGTPELEEKYLAMRKFMP